MRKGRCIEMENNQFDIAKIVLKTACIICGRKGKISYPPKLTAERENSLCVKRGEKALYIGNVAVTADAHVCRIGLESLPYPKQMCITSSTRLSVKKNTKENLEVIL